MYRRRNAVTWLAERAEAEWRTERRDGDRLRQTPSQDSDLVAGYGPFMLVLLGQAGRGSRTSGSRCSLGTAAHGADTRSTTKHLQAPGQATSSEVTSGPRSRRMIHTLKTPCRQGHLERQSFTMTSAIFSPTCLAQLDARGDCTFDQSQAHNLK